MIISTANVSEQSVVSWIGLLNDGFILVLLPESFRVLLSQANYGFCYFNFTRITTFRYERKNALNSGALGTNQPGGNLKFKPKPIKISRGGRTIFLKSAEQTKKSGKIESPEITSPYFLHVNGKDPWDPFLSLRASSPGRSGGGAGRGRSACNYVEWRWISVSKKIDAKCWLGEMTVMTSLLRVFQCMFTFVLVSASHWLAEIWQLNRRGATGDLEVEFKFQRRSCKVSFVFPPRRKSAWRACSQAPRFSKVPITFRTRKALLCLPCVHSWSKFQ